MGESGSGKSVTARALLRIVDKAGRITGGRILLRTEGREIDVAALDPRSRDIRAIRGRRIGLIFQEPMSSLSPVHTIGSQIVEAIRLHTALDRRPGQAAGDRAAAPGRDPGAGADGATATPSSSPAACGSGR